MGHFILCCLLCFILFDNCFSNEWKSHSFKASVSMVVLYQSLLFSKLHIAVSSCSADPPLLSAFLYFIYSNTHIEIHAYTHQHTQILSFPTKRLAYMVSIFSVHLV